MSSIGDFFGEANTSNLFQNSFNIGDVLLMDFEGVDHDKFFILVGISKDKIFACSIYINSNIHPSIFSKQELLELQIPIKKENNSFLKYDSFAGCNNPIPIDTKKIAHKLSDGTCRIIGKISDNEMEAIIEKVKNSGLLSDDEIELYF